MACKREIALSIVRGLKTFYQTEELVDFQVKVGDVQFGCHRVILAAISDFFRGLFRSGMKETEQKSVTLKDISSDVFESILESIYTGHVVLTNDNVIDIWKGAHQLQIHCLVSECENFVIKTISMENYAEYFYIGYTLESAGVLKTLWPFVLKNCYTFLKTTYFLQLPFSDVLRLIESQDLCTHSEDDVIHAILRWVEFQNDQRQRNVSGATCDGIADLDRRDGRQEHEGGSGDKLFVKAIDNIKTLTEGNNLDNVVDIGPCDNQVEIRAKENSCNHLLILLSHARLCLASQRCLQSLVTHSLVIDNKEARDIVFHALWYLAGKRNGQWPSRAVHRKNSDFIHCLVDARKMGNDVIIRAYSLSTQKWLQLPGLVKVRKIKLAAVDNKLYALCTETTDLGISCFQLEKGTWFKVNVPLYNCRSKYFHCAVVDACVYIFSTQEKVAHKLDVTSHKVQMLSGSSKYKDIVYIAPYDQWILVFYTDAQFQCYDTVQSTWGNVSKFDGSSNGMTSFRDDHFTYILQSNGNLWKVVKPHSDTIDFEFVVKLWSSDRALYGAVTFLDELYIHRGAPCVSDSDSSSNSDSDDEASDDDDIYIRRSLPGAFSKIHYLVSKYPEISLSVGLPITLASNFFLPLVNIFLHTHYIS